MQKQNSTIPQSLKKGHIVKVEGGGKGKILKIEKGFKDPIATVLVQKDGHTTKEFPNVSGEAGAYGDHYNAKIKDIQFDDDLYDHGIISEGIKKRSQTEVRYFLFNKVFEALDSDLFDEEVAEQFNRKGIVLKTLYNEESLDFSVGDGDGYIEWRGGFLEYDKHGNMHEIEKKGSRDNWMDLLVCCNNPLSDGYCYTQWTSEMVHGLRKYEREQNEKFARNRYY